MAGSEEIKRKLKGKRIMREGANAFSRQAGGALGGAMNLANKTVGVAQPWPLGVARTLNAAVGGGKTGKMKPKTKGPR